VDGEQLVFTPGRLAFSMEHKMPFVEHARFAAGPSYSTSAALQAAGIPDPHAEIGFKDGCARMGFYRQNFQVALKRQWDMDALGKRVDGARLPEPHWKDDSQWFYLREVEAYTAARQSE
jgi:hypothetical protein